MSSSVGGMPKRGAGSRASSPAADEAAKKPKVGNTDKVRNADVVHANGHVNNICLPTTYERERYNKLYINRKQVDAQVRPNWSPAYARHVLLCASFFLALNGVGSSQNKKVPGAYGDVQDGTPDSLLIFGSGVKIRDSTAALLGHERMEGTVAKSLCDDYETACLADGIFRFPTGTGLAHKSVQKIPAGHSMGKQFDPAVIFREPSKDGFGPQPVQRSAEDEEAITTVLSRRSARRVSLQVLQR